MGDTANESADKIRYRVEKISKDLETLTLDEHITVCNMLTQLLTFRAGAQVKADQASERELKAATERERRFGLIPGDATPPVGPS